MSASSEIKSVECTYCGHMASELIDNRWELKDVILALNPSNPNASLGIQRGKKVKTYVECDNCNKKYINTDIEIGDLMPFITVDEKSENSVVNSMIHYYGNNIGLSELLINHTTGVVRSYDSKLSYLSSIRAKATLYICFNHNNIRTYAIVSSERNTKRVEVYCIKTFRGAYL